MAAAPLEPTSDVRSVSTRRPWPGRLARVAFSLLLFFGLDLTVKRVVNARRDRLEAAEIAQVAVLEQYRVAHPVYHHGLAPSFTTQSAVWGRLRYELRTNSLGFKDGSTRIVPATPAPGQRRLLVIGDSFAEGIGIPWEKTFAGILAQAWRVTGPEVLNASVASYSPIVYWRKVRSLLDDGLRFDELVVFLDLGDPDDEANVYALEDDRVVFQQRPDAAPEPPEPMGFRSWMIRHTLLGEVVSDARSDLSINVADTRHRVGWTTDPALVQEYAGRGLASCARYLEQLRALCRERSIPMTLVVYPWPYQIATGDRDSLQVQHWRDWARAHDTAFIDLFPTFMPEGRSPAQIYRDYFIEGDEHWNDAGHRLVAAELQRHLHP